MNETREKDLKNLNMQNNLNNLDTNYSIGLLALARNLFILKYLKQGTLPHDLG